MRDCALAASVTLSLRLRAERRWRGLARPGALRRLRRRRADRQGIRPALQTIEPLDDLRELLRRHLIGAIELARKLGESARRVGFRRVEALLQGIDTRLEGLCVIGRAAAFEARLEPAETCLQGAQLVGKLARLLALRRLALPAEAGPHRPVGWPTTFASRELAWQAMRRDERPHPSRAPPRPTRQAPASRDVAHTAAPVPAGEIAAGSRALAPSRGASGDG